MVPYSRSFLASSPSTKPVIMDMVNNVNTAHVPSPSPSASPPLPPSPPATDLTKETSRPTTPSTSIITSDIAEKKGRHSRITSCQDLIIVREKTASKAHIASFEETQTRFQATATRANDNPSLNQRVTWKTVQDRYKRLQEIFDKKDRRDQRMSGVGGEVSEIDELLMTMREARDDQDAKKTAERDAAKALDDEKERVGWDIIRSATKRKNSGSDGRDEGDVGSEGKERSAKEPRVVGGRNGGKGGYDTAGEMERFGMCLRDVDLARVAVYREHLLFEKERLEMETEERELERKERRDEREAQQKLYLEKFKLMLDAFQRK